MIYSVETIRNIRREFILRNWLTQLWKLASAKSGGRVAGWGRKEGRMQPESEWFGENSLFL